MKKTVFLLASILLMSCTKTEKKEPLSNSKDTENSVTKSDISEDLVMDSLFTKENEKIDIIFDNSSQTATVLFEGNQVQLEAQKTASGIRYTGSGYELLGKGTALELKKDSITIAKKQ
ncbi:MliC family protein [Chryseobacterium binzhouense]|uniref:MliC family protein n=1 Tax=Chryseobacterium binzhouense TaxID=2593646 RepID=UPI0028A0A35E|nr:MliC family protein [Chryseobacterium binzhouense]